MTRTLAPIWASILASACCAAQEPRIERPGPPASDDFEVAVNGVPEGWYNLRDAKILPTGGPSGPHFVRFENAKPGRQARISRAFGVDGRKTEALVVGLWIKGNGLSTGERLGEDASLQIDFLGESLTTTGRGFLGPWTDRYGTGWVRVSRRIPVAPGTRDAILTLGLIGAIGTLEVDGLTIEEVPVGGAATTNLLMNGGFELGDPDPKFWTVEDGSSRLFPGHNSPSALEIKGAGSRALSGLGVRVDRISELEISIDARGKNLRRTGGGAGKIYFRDADGRSLAPPDDGASLFRWTGTFDWKTDRARVRVPTAATRAVFQVETVDAGGSLEIDDVIVRAAPDPDQGRWTPYHVEESTDGWRPLDGSPAIAKGSALDASNLLEAPAGRHGGVVVKDGRLHFADGQRARFFGVAILPPLAFADRDTADALADRLARSGVNLARFDSLDAPMGSGQSLHDDTRDDTLALDPEAIAKFDHLIAALKSRGIYVAFELLSGRRFREGDGVPGWIGLPAGGGQAAAFDPKIRDLTLKAADALLGHVNPETNMALRDDPVLAWVVLAGEVSLLDRIDDDDALPPDSRSILNGLMAKGPTGRMGWSQVESAQWKAVAEALRKSGLKRPIAGSSHWRREPEFNAAQTRPGLDLIDDRLYWSPPRFGAPEHRSMLWRAAGTIASEAEHKRKRDRPYAVGEWCAHTDGAWALPFEGADLLLASHLAAINDWDGLVRRGVAAHPKVWGSAPAGSSGGGDTFAAPEVINANPQVFAMLPHAASLFLRSKDGQAHAGKASPTAWDQIHGRLAIDTPHTQGLAGWAAHKPAKLDNLTIEVDTNYAVVMATSLGSDPIASSKRILVTAVAKAQPTGLLYADQWHREVGSHGQGPILIEPVRARVTIRRKGAVRAFALKPDGARGVQIPMKSTSEGSTLEIDPEGAVLHWEIVVP